MKVNVIRRDWPFKRDAAQVGALLMEYRLETPLCFKKRLRDELKGKIPEFTDIRIWSCVVNSFLSFFSCSFDFFLIHFHFIFILDPFPLFPSLALNPYPRCPMLYVNTVIGCYWCWYIGFHDQVQNSARILLTPKSSEFPVSDQVTFPPWEQLFSGNVAISGLNRSQERRRQQQKYF